MRINQNISAMNTYSRLTSANTAKSNSLAKLSSGLRINKAGDDAAGLAISEKMRGQVSGLNQAAKNAQDGISLIQTAEGALNETHSILQRMRELAVQSSNDTNTNADRTEIQKEMDQLAQEMTRISNTTEFNTQNLLNGGIKNTKFHIGANQGQDIKIGINAMDAFALGVTRDTFTGTGAGDIASATFDATTGSKVASGDTLTFAYQNITTATAASITGTAAATTLDAGTAGDLKLKINGADVNVTLANGDDQAAIINKINTAANTALGTAAETYASSDTGIKISSGLTTGSNSSVEILNTSTAATLGALKLTVSNNTGLDVGKTITISNATTADDQVVSITDDTATSLEVSSGNYGGLKINLAASKTLADLDSTNDKVTIGTESASSATFNSAGEKTADAVTKAGINVSSQDAASNAITTLDDAIAKVSSERSKLGAVQNRLDHTINNLTATSENLSAAESRIRDVDMAKEMMDFTKNNILSQAATSMLAQANQMPQSVLQLLQ